MAKTDNTRQTLYDFKGVVLDKTDDGILTLSNDEIGTIKLDSVLNEYLGQEIDFKIGGAVKVSNELFREDE